MIPEADDFGWFHVLGVMVVDDEVEASNYVPMVVRYGGIGMQIRSNRPHKFKIHRGGFARLALMNGDFERKIYIDVGPVHFGNTVDVLS